MKTSPSPPPPHKKRGRNFAVSLLLPVSVCMSAAEYFFVFFCRLRHVVLVTPLPLDAIASSATWPSCTDAAATCCSGHPRRVPLLPPVHCHRRTSRHGRCVNKHTLERKAVKIIMKEDMKQDEKDLLRAEIAIMRLVNHPNIIRMEAVYESKKVSKQRIRPKNGAHPLTHPGVEAKKGGFRVSVRTRARRWAENQKGAHTIAELKPKIGSFVRSRRQEEEGKVML